jgi:DNA-binding NarL/FixJ family response regulator
VAYARLVQQGRSERAFPTILARFAIAQVRDGRKVGTSINSRDVMSRRAQQRQKFMVERIDRFEHGGAQWAEAIVADSRTPIADQVWFRIDFPEWLRRLSRRDRRVALVLAEGHRTSDVAKRFRLSPGRISQLRHQLHDAWQTFHGEAVLA